jgi:alpha-galactosidase
MQTYGLAVWVPYFGTSAGSLDPYTFRSEMTPAMGIGPNPKLHGDSLQLQLRLIAEWRRVASFYYGDFFPLTEYSQDETTWMAWQWNSFDGSAGIVQAFRRQQSPFSSATFALHHLKPDATYVVEDLDSHRRFQISGKDLIQKGIDVNIDNSPGAVIFNYRESSSH